MVNLLNFSKTMSFLAHSVVYCDRITHVDYIKITHSMRTMCKILKCEYQISVVHIFQEYQHLRHDV